MKRGINALLLVLVVFFAGFIPTYTSPTSALSEDDFFIYELSASHIYAKIDSEKSTLDGYYQGGSYHPPGTKVNATIDYIAGHGTMFRFFIDNSSSVAFISPDWFDLFAVEKAYITLASTFLMIDNFNAINMMELSTFSFHPYIYLYSCDYLANPDSFGNAIGQVVDDWFYGEREIDCLYTHSESEGIIYIESWIGGKIDENFGVNIGAPEDYPTDISFGNGFHIAVNSSSGVVYGWGQHGWVKGRINGKQVRFSMAWEYALDGYVFPDYQFGEIKHFQDINLYLIIFLPAISLGILVPTIIYFYNKRRFNKLLKSS